MVKVALSSFKNRLVISIALIGLAGCATSAPALPPDTTSINRSRPLTLDDFTPQARAMSCADIALERQKISNAMKTANTAIEGNRTRNQVAGYFAALAFFPIVATENNDAEKDEITKLYKRQDLLIQLGALKHCADVPPS
jgi:hypothetical protein